MCLWVLGRTTGLRRKQMRAIFFNFFAQALISSSSSRDSTLKELIPLPGSLSAKIISSSVLPTPEKTMLLAGIPDSRARLSSPPETMSAPEPSFARILTSSLFGFDLSAKQIRGSIRPESFAPL